MRRPARRAELRAVLRRRVMPAALFSLAAGLFLLVPAPQAALAAARGTSSISAGTSSSCAIESGKAYCWGANGNGQLGNGSTTSSSVPVAVDTSGVLAGKTLTQIAAGKYQACALDTHGAAYCWGYNGNGELGDGSPASSSVPVAVDTSGVLAGQTLTQIVAGNQYTCAVDAAGGAYCWGYNPVGELGDGSTADSSVPVAVDTSGVLAGQTLTQITAGFYDHTCALGSAGAAYCWGGNEAGQLGNGTTTDSSVPVAVDTSGVLAGQTLTQITAGESHTCALDSAGAAYCWGYNEQGQLGAGVGKSSDVPVAVNRSGAPAGQAFTQITAGGYDACVLDSAGAAHCWGDNACGELGNGRDTPPCPVAANDASHGGASPPGPVDASRVAGGKTLSQIDGGNFYACAADAAGALYCWGDNTSGEAGDGSTTQRDTPVLVGPQAPAGVAAAPADTAATVSWTGPASLDGGTLTGYTATASPGGKTCATTGATTCKITGLANGRTFMVTVVAHTTAGDSGASAPATVTPEPPGGITGPIVAGDNKAKCVDDSNDSAANDTPVVIGDCNGSQEQNWTVESDGTIQVNGKCMNIYRAERSNKAPVDLWTCTGGANQRWHAVNGTLVNPVSGRCLDDPAFKTADGTQLEIFTCTGGANQQWKLP
jgi:alpha-tubulin suppressor-like RCC1 family protein